MQFLFIWHVEIKLKCTVPYIPISELLNRFPQIIFQRPQITSWHGAFVYMYIDSKISLDLIGRPLKKATLQCLENEI